MIVKLDKIYFSDAYGNLCKDFPETVQEDSRGAKVGFKISYKRLVLKLRNLRRFKVFFCTISLIFQLIFLELSNSKSIKGFF